VSVASPRRLTYTRPRASRSVVRYASWLGRNFIARVEVRHRAVYLPDAASTPRARFARTDGGMPEATFVSIVD
jgi:hypothetical protein